MHNPADDSFQALLAEHLPAHVFVEVTDGFFEEPRRRFEGVRGPVLAPTSVEEIATIVKLCNAHTVAIIPYGGGTGLVAGQIALEGAAPVVLSLHRMKAQRSLSLTENVLVAEAGMTLAAVREAAQTHDRLFPLSLASEGTCTIGGVLATNAGGVNTLRYGNARALCLGVEAVLPTGDIWHGLTPLRKDNLGYDLRDLLIGAEGSLGIITAASLRLSPCPEHERAAFLVVPGPSEALELLNLVQAQLGEVVSAFELMHRQGFDFMAEAFPDTKQPFDVAPEWSVLIDLGLTGIPEPDQAIETLMQAAFEKGLAVDGVMAQSERQRQEFWTFRESIPLANRHIGAISSHDISVPLEALPEFIARGYKVVEALGEFRVNCFGHAGDGNLHYNVFPPKGPKRDDYDDQREEIKRAVHDLVVEYGGSVAAEHGVGRLKVGDLERYGDPAMLGAMRAIKSALDPKNILNPGVLLS